MLLKHRRKKRKPLSREHCENISQALLGSVRKEETRQKQAASRRAFLEKAPRQVHSEKTKEKIAKKMAYVAQNRRKRGEVHVCPWCGKEGKAPVWHFRNCLLCKEFEDS